MKQFLVPVAIQEIASGPTPASGFLAIYSKSDHKLYAKDSTGTETNLFSTAGTPGGSTTQIQYNSSGSFAGDANFVWNTSTGLTVSKPVTFSQATGTNGLVTTITSNGGNLLNQYATGSLVLNATIATAVFQTAASGSVSGADTGGYTDITTTYNTSFVNITNGGASLKRFYIGYYDGTPTTFACYYTGTGGTNGVTGTIIWEFWNGSAWSSFTGSNLTGDGNMNVTASSARSTINGVSAYWIRGTVNTAYTTAPVYRFSVLDGLQNGASNFFHSTLWLSRPNLPSAILANMTNKGVISIVTGGNGEQNILASYSEYTGAPLFTLRGDGSFAAPNGDCSVRSFTINGGASNNAYTLKLGNSNKTISSWGVNGCYFQSASATMTDFSTATSGTATIQTFNSFAAPTLAATNTSVTTTDAATVYIAGAPANGTNNTITNPWSLLIAAGKVKFSGDVMHSAANIYTDTTTGMKIGTATNQKIGFFNSTPIVQPTGSVITGLTNLGLIGTPTINFTELTGTLGTTQMVALTGDVTNTSGTVSTTIANNVVTNAKLSTIATSSFKGRVTAGTGNVEDLTGTQATTLLDTFTSGLKGLAPASGGGTTNFLRADGSWAAPSGGGGATWNTSTTTPITATASNSYVANSASLITFNLPTPSLGATIEITGLGAGGWVAQCASGHTIRLGSTVSATTGSAASTNQFDSVRIVGVSTTQWHILSAIGTLDIV